MKYLSNKWFVLSILAITWGSSFIMIKQSVAVYTPIQVGALRLCVAGLVLVGLGWRNIQKIPKKLLPWVILGGSLGNFFPMFLFPLAQKQVSSSMAGILDSLVPIFVLIFGALFFGFKSRWTQLMGAVLGFVGAVILMKDGTSDGSGDWFHTSLIILATVMYGFNSLIISRFLNGIPSFQLSSAVFTIWLGPSMIVLGFSGFFTEFTGTETQWKGLGYIAILGLIGTALAMILYYNLIQKTSAIFASTVTYLMPIVAVFWGILDGEKLSSKHAIGGLLILAGVYLIQMSGKTSITDSEKSTAKNV